MQGPLLGTTKLLTHIYPRIIRMPGLAFCAGRRKVTGKGQSSGKHVCSASLSPCESEATSTHPINASRNIPPLSAASISPSFDEFIPGDPLTRLIDAKIFIAPCNLASISNTPGGPAISQTCLQHPGYQNASRAVPQRTTPQQRPSRATHFHFASRLVPKRTCFASSSAPDPIGRLLAGKTSI